MSGNTVGGTKPSISDDDALYFWDRITRSIRARPVDNNR
ncbi:T6SS immunity protein Tli4 family protein [Pseudoduganella sp. RAF53_2]